MRDGGSSVLPNPTRLAAAGPTSEEHGFPLWYRDKNGVRLAIGLDPDDPNTPAGLDELPSPGDPVSFPGNFPPEAFYSLVSAELLVGGTPAPGRARVVLGLEATFGGSGEPVDGQQMVFARVRVRLRGGLPETAYVFTHPYGQTEPLTTDEEGDIFVTEDIGAFPLDFGAAVQDGEVAPFLSWTTGSPGEADPPAGYLGDGQTEHTITGSPLQIDGRPLNFFRLEGPGVGDVGGGPRDPLDPTNIDRIQTPLFTVQGKIATVLGVDIRRAVYSRTAAGTVLDVFASTEPGQTLQVSGPDVATTGLRGAGGNYLARAAAGPATPGKPIIVTNTTDNPPTIKTAIAVDAVTITTADYDMAAGTLTVAAASSDVTGAPALTATGLGPLPAAGQAVFALAAPPATVTVTSAAGGSAERAVTVAGAVFGPLPPAARAGADQTVVQGQLVTLDGRASSGTAPTFAWAQTAGTTVVLNTPNAATTTFTAPNAAGDLTFTLTVTDPGGPLTDQVVVHVPPLNPLVDTIIIARAQFRTSGQQWRIDGTASGQLPNRVTVSFDGHEIGTAAVDAANGWDVRRTITATEPELRPLPGAVVTVTSTRNGSDTLAVNVRN